jgi:photosynthesis system II assembly factor YCF48-like protein
MLPTPFTNRFTNVMQVKIEELAQEATSRFSHRSAELAVRGHLSPDTTSMLHHEQAVWLTTKRIESGLDAIRRLMPSHELIYSETLAEELKALIESWVTETWYKQLIDRYGPLNDARRPNYERDIVLARNSALTNASLEIDLLADASKHRSESASEDQQKEKTTQNWDMADWLEKAKRHPIIVVVGLVVTLITTVPALRDGMKAIKDTVLSFPTSPRSWEVYPIQGQRQAWEANWRDVVWIEFEGWLCGYVQMGGGGGEIGMDLGEGILLHTTNAGQSWDEIPKKNFDSGSGTFYFGPNKYTWQEVGPILSMLFGKRPLGKDRYSTEGWLATTTGVYSSNDAGNHWRRSTPSPNQSSTSYPFSHHGTIEQVELFSEIYAAGWQGIAHWSRATDMWEVQLPTGSFAISKLFLYPGKGGLPSIWAVGHVEKGTSSSSGIFRLQYPSTQWEPIIPEAVNMNDSAVLHDVLQIDARTVFVIGTIDEKGNKALILRGKRTDADKWNWERLRTPAQEILNSIALDKGVLWVVGENGTIFFSDDYGDKWNRLKLDEKIRRSFYRIRFFDGTGWIIGNKIVLRSPKT